MLIQITAINEYESSFEWVFPDLLSHYHIVENFSVKNIFTFQVKSLQFFTILVEQKQKSL